MTIFDEFSCGSRIDDATSRRDRPIVARVATTTRARQTTAAQRNA
jgi:hypothetical protein